MGTCTRYDNLAWLSYVRGRPDSGVAAEMRAHSESCNECHDWVEFCRTIAEAVDLNSATPPESWMEEAVAAFKSAHPNRASSDSFGELVYDSYLHDKEAVRSPRMEIRHLVF